MADENEPDRSHTRVPKPQRLLEDRVANPLFRAVLRSPLHWLASRWLVLVSYVGPRSGRRYAFPVVYHRVGDAVVAVTPRTESNWWRNFRTPRRCTVWLRGTNYAASGAVVTGDERGPLVDAYFERHGLVGRMLGSDRGGRSRARPYEDLAVVRFALDAE
ncbi:MAG: hypothetical protein ABEI96_08605 [Haloarculaceae archaeon]